MIITKKYEGSRAWLLKKAIQLLTGEYGNSKTQIGSEARLMKQDAKC